MNVTEIAFRVVNHVPGMIAYWNAQQRCVFSNDAYREWFGRSPEEMVGMHIKDLLGPLYEKNLPHIEAALQGERQVFERQIPLPQGGVRESMATYTPDVIDGKVAGFSVHVSDVTLLRAREEALQRTVHERDAAMSEIRTLQGLLPICASCKDIRDTEGRWQPIEGYVSQRADVNFTHGLCPKCVPNYLPKSDDALP